MNLQRSSLEAILVLIILLVQATLYSQRSISDNFYLKATYQLTAFLDSTDLAFRTQEKHVLLIGEKISSFSSAALRVDQTVKIYGNSGSTPKNAITEFPYVIYKVYPDQYRSYSQNIIEDNFLYSESMADMKWDLINERKEINGYECIKAQIQWKGRLFTAWFTTEIPISDGPYKFSGLPGLIVNLYDDKMHYNYEMLSLEKLEKPLKFRFATKDFVEVDRKELDEIWISYRRDPFSYYNSPNITIAPEVHQAYIKGFEELLKKRNNPIELIE